MRKLTLIVVVGMLLAIPAHAQLFSDRSGGNFLPGDYDFTTHVMREKNVCSRVKDGTCRRPDGEIIPSG
jgi:hypothetical protein